MVRAFRAFLEFCYLVRRDVHTDETVAQVQDALERFHRYCVIFETTGVCPDGISLPQQHSLVHYPKLIRMFGAPNGLCSSITEAKHIKAVKEPWRRSSRYEPLDQILLTNQRLDKLAAAHIDFASRGMLDSSVVPSALHSYGMSHPLSFNSLADTIVSDNIYCDDDPNTQDDDFGGQSTMSSPSMRIDEQPDIQPVND